MENENSSGKGRGGARPGAGRPRNDTKLFAFRLPKEMADYVDEHDNKTDFIKDCISRRMMEVVSVDSLGEVYSATNVRSMNLPFFDISVVAGFPIPLDNDEKAQDIDLLRMLCPNPEASYLIRVKGLSMIDAGINDGDIVIVDKSRRNPSEREVAVCEYNGEYTLKHVVRREGMLFLVPDNPDFPEWEIHEYDSFAVWGTVTYVIHRPK